MQDKVITLVPGCQMLPSSFLFNKLEWKILQTIRFPGIFQSIITIPYSKDFKTQDNGKPWWSGKKNNNINYRGKHIQLFFSSNTGLQSMFLTAPEITCTENCFHFFWTHLLVCWETLINSAATPTFLSPEVLHQTSCRLLAGLLVSTSTENCTVSDRVLI